MKHYLLFLILLLTLPLSFGTTINLLAASEGLDVGSVIPATLETTPGTGRVFIENNLISNPDTQISVKFANQIVCSNYLDCTEVDFFYTINGATSIVTGPSGGSSIALLTYAHLIGEEIPRNIAMSGTINSGGYVGTVGGLKEKIRGAKNYGVNKVLIPFANENSIDYSSVNLTNSSLNISLLPKTNLSKFGENYSVEVISVATFDDILLEVFGIESANPEIIKPEFYSRIMANIENEICTVTDDLLTRDTYEFPEDYSSYYCSGGKNCTDNYMSNITFDAYTNIQEYRAKANELYNYSVLSNTIGDYYSSASYCFGANMNLRYIEFLTLPLSASRELANESINGATDALKNKFETLNDVQVYSVVKERILDATRSFEEAVELESEGKILQAIDKYSYAYERAKTALAWSNFYDVPSSKEISGSLMNACDLAIRDADSRIQYLKLYLNIPLESEETLENAKNSQFKEDYAMCIYYALEAKAKSDIVSSVFGSDEKQITEVLNVKKRIAEKFVAEQYEKGNYPILGYSYLEYGSSLVETTPYSSLLYFQLAQELSNLDLFFEASSKTTYVTPVIPKVRSDLFLFLFGLLAGVLIAVSIHALKKIGVSK